MTENRLEQSEAKLEPPRPRVLVSACLLGQPIRYDGGHCRLSDNRLQHWVELGWVVPLCPEVEGGLSVPRVPAEIQADDRVVTREGEDVSPAFLAGALHALRVAQQHGITLALLKANSPSCGNAKVYSGQFDGKLISGEGITARLLRRNGISVFNENQLDALAEALDRTTTSLGSG